MKGAIIMYEKSENIADKAILEKFEFRNIKQEEAKLKILLDAMGGDNAPDANIKGAVSAINEVEAEVVLIGKEEVIKEKIKKNAV